MQDITELSLSDKTEIAGYIKRDNLDIVNEAVEGVRVRQSIYTKYVKRFLDIIVSAAALVVTLPVNIVLAVATYLDVGTPLIFRQQRVGRDGKKFIIYKFRNMTNDKDVNGELLPPGQRVTKWGRFVRRTSLDELLNFVAVLTGSMSIIGPRPLPDYYGERLNNRHKGIYKVRPGLECPTPCKVEHKLSWQERLDNYVWYVENCSFLVDLKLCFRMVQLAFDKKEVKRRSGAGRGGLLGYDRDGNVISTKSVPDNYVAEFCANHGYANLEEAVSMRQCHGKTSKLEGKF